MKQFLVILGLMICIYACNDSPQKRMIAFHEVVNEIIDSQIVKPEPVILELVENRQEIPDRAPDIILGSNVYWDKSFFIGLYDKGLIDSLDVRYMFDQAKSSNRYNIDPLRINRHTIRRKDFESLIIKVGYDSTLQYLKHKYNSRSVLFFSNPIFSHDGDKVLINADYYCGRLCGAQTRFLYEKEGKRWKLLLVDEYEKR